MIRSPKSMSGYSFATSSAVRRNSPSENFMMFALCAAVTLRRPFSRAYSNAARTILVVPKTEIGLIEMPASSRIVLPDSSAIVSRSRAASAEPCSNSMPAYRSSWFSRTMTTSTFS
jgi:hypothetical protein